MTHADNHVTTARNKIWNSSIPIEFPRALLLSTPPPPQLLATAMFLLVEIVLLGWCAKTKALTVLFLGDS